MESDVIQYPFLIQPASLVKDRTESTCCSCCSFRQAVVPAQEPKAVFMAHGASSTLVED